MYYVLKNEQEKTVAIYPITCSKRWLDVQIAYLKQKHGKICITIQ